MLNLEGLRTRVLSATTWWCLPRKKSVLSTVGTNDAAVLSKHFKSSWKCLIIIRALRFLYFIPSPKSLQKATQDSADETAMSYRASDLWFCSSFSFHYSTVLCKGLKPCSPLTCNSAGFVAETLIRSPATLQSTFQTLLKVLTASGADLHLKCVWFGWKKCFSWLKESCRTVSFGVG